MSKKDDRIAELEQQVMSWQAIAAVWREKYRSLDEDSVMREAMALMPQPEVEADA